VVSLETKFGEHGNSYFLHPGYVFVSQEPYYIHTVLGSCVAIAIWDKVNHCGGMNHYVLPSAENKPNGRYGNVSIPYLFYLMKKINSDRNNLEIHVLGGSSNETMKSSVGPLNVEFALNWLKSNHYQIDSKDTGGALGRKIVFNTENGELLIYKLKKIRDSDWYGE